MVIALPIDAENAKNIIARDIPATGLRGTRKRLNNVGRVQSVSTEQYQAIVPVIWVVLRIGASANGN